MANLFKKFTKKVEETSTEAVAPKTAVEKKLTEKQEKHVQDIMEKTGWDKNTVVTKIEEAKANCGINYANYNRYNFFEIPVEDQKKEHARIQQEREQKKRQKEHRIERVMTKTGWDHDYAAEKMADARKRIGCSYREYLIFELYDVPEDQQKEVYEEKLERRAASKERTLDKNVNKVMEKTGWDYDTARERLVAASERTGCTPNEYYFYKFYELTDAQQDDVFIAKFSRKITAKYDVDNDFVNILYDKERSNEFFSEYMRRPWCVNTKVTKEEFIEKFANSNKVFYKPLDGHHGDGAAPFDLTPETIGDVYDTVSTYPEGVVEEYVVQHPKMQALAPSAVNTVRMVTISNNDNPVTPDGRHIDVAYASLKMGGANSIVDNLTAGGMVAGIDLETGKLVTNAADEFDHVFEKHPVTGTVIKGFEIPFFKETIEMVYDCYEKKKIQGYLGWDIAITEDGPMVIEVNVVPGVILFTLPYIEEKKGMKHVMAKYL